MYHPLLVFDGRTSFPLAGVLPPGNTHGTTGPWRAQAADQEVEEGLSKGLGSLPGGCRLCRSRTLSLSGTAGGPLRRLHHQQLGIIGPGSPAFAGGATAIPEYPMEIV
jgi:hypothetical protein